MLKRLLGVDVELCFRSPPELWSCKADPSQVEQVVMNLVVNARDAMPDGGVITIEAGNAELDDAYCRQHPEASPGRYCMLAVIDTGMGMDSDVLARIFEPFFTTKPRGIGTGLGLASVYGIAKQRGGCVAVASQPAAGTTFKVYFPRSETSESGVHTAVKVPVHARGTETVLVVEDHEQVRKLVSRILKQEGYGVVEAATPQTAMALFEQESVRIDLLLTDVIMPGMSGPQLARQLLRNRPNLKVLYMSGYTENTVAAEDLSAHHRFIQKPLVPSALLGQIHELLHVPLSV